MQVIVSRDRLASVACDPGQRAFANSFPRKAIVVDNWTDFHQGYLLADPVWRTFWGFSARKGLIPRLPITNLDLSGADLSNADVCYADFTGSNLRNSNFTNVNAYRAIFRNCNLTGAKFAGANIQYAIFTGAKF